jgi:hypothetical protein
MILLQPITLRGFHERDFKSLFAALAGLFCRIKSANCKLTPRQCTAFVAIHGQQLSSFLAGSADPISLWEPLGPMSAFLNRAWNAAASGRDRWFLPGYLRQHRQHRLHNQSTIPVRPRLARSIAMVADAADGADGVCGIGSLT